MVKITLEVKGMACGMCESHINDTVRRQFEVKKVSGLGLTVQESDRA